MYIYIYIGFLDCFFEYAGEGPGEDSTLQVCPRVPMANSRFPLAMLRTNGSSYHCSSQEDCKIFSDPHTLLKTMHRIDCTCWCGGVFMSTCFFLSLNSNGAHVPASHKAKTAKMDLISPTFSSKAWWDVTHTPRTVRPTF